MIIMDLEWNRGYDKKPLNEILQIGAVRVQRLGGPIVDVFNACIRPTVHKKFDLGARKLPELGTFKASHQRFPGAAEAFRAWCGEDKVFAGWGTGDVEALNQNCKYWGLAPFEAEEFFDFQLAFAHAVGADQQIALWRAAEYCGVPDVFDYHSAVNDAMYTAILGRWLTPEDLAWRPEPALPRRRRVALRLSQLPFPRQPRQESGPFQTRSEALNAWSGRNPACPLCGVRHGIARWHFAPSKDGQTPRQYYGAFSCPDHGRFLCRLTLTQGPDGLWQAARDLPEITPELIQAYAAALDGGGSRLQKPGAAQTEAACPDCGTDRRDQLTLGVETDFRILHKSSGGTLSRHTIYNGRFLRYNSRRNEIDFIIVRTEHGRDHP